LFLQLPASSLVVVLLLVVLLVTITGTNLGGATAVNFGSTSVTIITNSDSQITVNNVPAGIDGTVEVTVTTLSGTSATSTADQFTCTVQAPTDNEKYNNEEHNGDRDNNYSGSEYGGYGGAIVPVPMYGSVPGGYVSEPYGYSSKPAGAIKTQNSESNGHKAKAHLSKHKHKHHTTKHHKTGKNHSKQKKHLEQRN
jgi:hypothetical protein